MEKKPKNHPPPPKKEKKKKKHNKNVKQTKRTTAPFWVVWFFVHVDIYFFVTFLIYLPSIL